MKKNGFTLIELIGVIAILALVMVVSIPQVMSTMTNSQVKADEREKKDLELAAETYVEMNWGNDVFKNEVIAGINGSKKVYCLPLSKIADSNTDNKFVMLQKVNGNSSTYRFSFTYVDKSASTDPNKDKC